MSGRDDEVVHEVGRLVDDLDESPQDGLTRLVKENVRQAADELTADGLFPPDPNAPK